MLDVERLLLNVCHPDYDYDYGYDYDYDEGFAERQKSSSPVAERGTRFDSPPPEKFPSCREAIGGGDRRQPVGQRTPGYALKPNLLCYKILKSL